MLSTRLVRFCLMVAALGCLHSGGARAQDSVDAKLVEFNRDIRPILSENCFACHGPDQGQRKAKLRLDTEEGALGDRPKGKVIVPGKPMESELYLRISNPDEEKRMPPAHFGKRLTGKQIADVRAWIERGANWQKHWSLIAPKRPALPEVRDKQAAINAIDRFLLARLEAANLGYSPSADKRTLLRRASFDLLGLPPSPRELDQFLADSSPAAFEAVVDRLLASEHFGERMAMYWLDLVRFADTAGYHSDNHRDLALYRDYVIRAFNDNMPFDRFTREQLAGDLLPNSTDAQRIASGYNRLLMTTEEGGSQPKEYMAKYAADRVRNASTVWLGLTLGCAECHDHKFDPVYTRDFYRFAAFFADIQEKAVGRQDQSKFPNQSQAAALRTLDEKIAAQQAVLSKSTPELEAAQVGWEASLLAADLRKFPKPVQDAFLVEPGKRSAEQKSTVAAHYRTLAPILAKERAELTRLQQEKAQLDRTIPTTLVSMSTAPRTMRILARGNWLDETGEVVSPGVPASLAPFPVVDRRGTRLDLADWLVRADNPLVARVFVNRMWKLFFGAGLVKTLDDFGSQGAWPTHPELLDWLAVEFRESGWDVKRLAKLMVLSRAYRQSSLVSEAMRQKDPHNQLLARQSRFRLDAEMVRDSVLSISGLLSPKIGGASARPYQPAGYWSLLNFPVREYQPDKGEGLYRRGVYTYWCRTFPHPSLVAFDAPSREECTVERPRSNTPLQALVLLNDPIYVEAARVFAEKILRQPKADTAARIRFALQLALGREPSPEETKILTRLHDSQAEHFRRDPSAAQKLTQVGDWPRPSDLDPAELAAWTAVTRAIFNLHELITRN